MSYDDWKTTEPDHYDDSERCEQCGRTPDRCLCDEWCHDSLDGHCYEGELYT